MARQDDHVRHTVRVPRAVYDRIATLPGEGSINAKIVNALDAATSGKTLRDELAMAALSSIYALTVEETARISYEIADAMLVARKGGA